MTTTNVETKEFEMKIVPAIRPMPGIRETPNESKPYSPFCDEVASDWRTQISWQLGVLLTTTGVEAFVYRLRGQWMFTADQYTALTFGKGRRSELGRVLSVIDSFALGYEFARTDDYPLDEDDSEGED